MKTAALVIFDGCEGCGHYVKGGAHHTCDYLLHTGKKRDCQPGMDCVYYTKDQRWKDFAMGKRGVKMPQRPVRPATPVLQQKSVGSVPPARSFAKRQPAEPEAVLEFDTIEVVAVEEPPKTLTVDMLIRLLHRCQMNGLGGNEVVINGVPLQNMDALPTRELGESVVIELGKGDCERDGEGVSAAGAPTAGEN